MKCGQKRRGTRKFSPGKFFTSQILVKRLLGMMINYTYTMMLLERTGQGLDHWLIIILHTDHFRYQTRELLSPLWTTPSPACAWVRGGWSWSPQGWAGWGDTTTPSWW